MDGIRIVVGEFVSNDFVGDMVPDAIVFVESMWIESGEYVRYCCRGVVDIIGIVDCVSLSS